MTDVEEVAFQYTAPAADQDVLQIEGDWLVDSRSKRRYPVRQGVAVLLRYQSSESEYDSERLTRMNQLASELGCIQALRQLHGEDSFFKYVTDPSRSIFLDLLPIQSTDCVLEIGSGLGQFTSMLASRCAHVCAMEVVEEQAIFTLKRSREAGHENVDVAAAGDDCYLPYADGSFDGVVVNLVLEWCGMREDGEPHEVLQRRMLTEICRVLKPGGFVFVSTKNRFALGYLLGRKDGHAHKMRFGNALPRWLMHLALRLKGKKRAIGMLHSYRYFQRMVRECGFENLKPYWAVPDMRRPKRFIPADAASIRAARREGGFDEADGRIAKRLNRFLPAWLVPHFAYGNVVLAYRKSE